MEDTELEQKGGVVSAVTKCLATFVIGLFAGVCAVFVPRLGGLLVAEDLNKITIFPPAFLILGLAYAAIVGAVVAILYHHKECTPAERFVAALGVPALLAGAISTTAHTGQVQKLQANTARLSDVAVEAAKIKKEDVPVDFTMLPTMSTGATNPGVSFERLLGIGSAYAQGPANIAGKPAGETKWTGWVPAISEEPKYAIIVGRSTTALAAEQRAQSLKGKLPNVMAVKTGSSYGVVAGVQFESSAVIEAIRIKRDLGLDTELVRVK